MKKYFIVILIVFVLINLRQSRELRKRRHSFLLPAVFDFAPFDFGLDSGIDDMLDSNLRNFQKFAEERLKKIDLRNTTNSTGLILFFSFSYASTSPSFSSSSTTSLLLYSFSKLFVFFL